MDRQAVLYLKKECLFLWVRNSELVSMERYREESNSREIDRSIILFYIFDGKSVNRQKHMQYDVRRCLKS